MIAQMLQIRYIDVPVIAISFSPLSVPLPESSIGPHDPLDNNECTAVCSHSSKDEKNSPARQNAIDAKAVPNASYLPLKMEKPQSGKNDREETIAVQTRVSKT